MNEQRFFIPGPEGNLEAVLTQPEIAGGLAVLCHPHPQYGGDMDDDVLAVAAAVLLANDTACLKFNFRGVGQSGGSYSGSAEHGDLEAVIEFTTRELAATALTIGGYSFGASVVTRLPATVRADRLLLIAPPTAMLDMARPAIAAPVDVFAGDADTYVDPAPLGTWQDTRLHLIEGADHFFSGRAGALELAFQNALAA